MHTDLESLAAWVADFEPDAFPAAAAGRLRAGLPPVTLLSAACLAVARGTELPFSHHGGPLHPVAAAPMALSLARSLPIELAWLPALQVAALACRHLRDPSMGPFLQPPMAPLAEATPAETAESLLRAVQRRQPALAEHYALGLFAAGDAALLRATLIRAALPNYATDEHKLILATHVIRALETLDPALAGPLARLVARYNALPDWFERPEGVPETIDAAVEAAGLAARPPAREPIDGDADRVPELRAALRDEPLEAAPAQIADALAAGLSLEGAADAITLAACDLFLASESRNAMGIHFMTGAHALREAMRVLTDPLEAARALLHWPIGPETRHAKSAADGEPWIPDAALSAAPLEALQAAIAAGDVEAAPSAVAWYGGADVDPAPVKAIIAAAATRDSATELHGLKHIAALLEECDRLREPWRWIALAAAAKEAALIEGRDQRVYAAAVSARR